VLVSVVTSFICYLQLKASAGAKQSVLGGICSRGGEGMLVSSVEQRCESRGGSVAGSRALHFFSR